MVVLADANHGAALPLTDGDAAQPVFFELPIRLVSVDVIAGEKEYAHSDIFIAIISRLQFLGDKLFGAGLLGDGGDRLIVIGRRRSLLGEILETAAAPLRFWRHSSRMESAVVIGRVLNRRGW